MNEIENIAEYIKEKAESRGWENAECMATDKFGEDKVLKAMEYIHIGLSKEPIVVRRDDLIKSRRNSPIQEIKLEDIKEIKLEDIKEMVLKREEALKADTIIIVDGDSKILKNRFGVSK